MLGIESLPAFLIAGSGVFFCVIEDERLLMRLDGKNRSVKLIEGKTEAHAFTHASGGASDHAADSGHCNAAIVGQTLEIASHRGGCRYHDYFSP